MSSNRKAAFFSVFAFGLIATCFVLLLQEVVITRKQWAEIPRVFAGLIAPIPVAVYLAFCFADRGGSAPPRELSPGRMTLLLAITTLAVAGIGWVSMGQGGGESIGMGPVLTQSAVFTSSVLNLLFLRSGPVAAVLSGTSIGMTGFLVFFA